MSRIGKEPVAVPDGVEVSLADGVLTVKGPKGTLTQEVHPDITVTITEPETDGDGDAKAAGKVVTVTRSDNEREHRALHGLTRALIANMVHGVTEGFERKLEIVGVGYRAAKQGTGIQVQVGYSHPVVVQPPEGVTLDVPSPTQITVSGTNKQKVGQVAADIRAIRKPEPYKGKGIRYAGEQIRRKAGKAAGA
jgi:large subunit ribosomal protein L6